MGLARIHGGQACKEHRDKFAGRPISVVGNCPSCRAIQKAVWRRRVGSGFLSKAAEVTQLSGAETLVITRIRGTGIAVWCSEGKSGAKELLNEALPFVPESPMQEPVIDRYLPEDVTRSRCYVGIGGNRKRMGRGSNRDSEVASPSFRSTGATAILATYTFEAIH